MKFNTNEVKKFTDIASEWWDEQKNFKMLHQINPTRLEYIINSIKHYTNRELKDLTIVDIGCGGGLISIPLARLGAKVLGIDAGKENIEVASKQAAKEQLNIDFNTITSEELTKTANSKFDIVICLELIEHLDDPQSLITDISALLKKDGLVIISTLNRTLKSKLLAINLAEYVLGWVPQGTHEFHKFVTPAELHNWALNNNLTIEEFKGLEFNIIKKSWNISNNIDVNYFAVMRRLNKN